MTLLIAALVVLTAVPLRVELTADILTRKTRDGRTVHPQHDTGDACSVSFVDYSHLRRVFVSGAATICALLCRQHF
jgi:hypothetical protein